MKKHLVFFTLLAFVATANLWAASPFSSDPADPVAGKVRYGNKIGVWEIEINIGIVKVKWTTVRCDGMPNVICVEKSGVPGQMATLDLGNEVISGKLLDEAERDFGDYYELYYFFESDSYSRDRK